MTNQTRLAGARGQSMIEMAIVLPLVVVTILGLIDISYALLDQHVVTKLTREGSNLISRDTSLQDAVNALKSMSSRPVDFSSTSTVIFSVVKRVATTGATNYNRDILYQRCQYGALAASSKLSTVGNGSFGAAPDYQANNSDNDANLQITNLPANINSLGGMIYVTEVYTSHQLLTPLNQFGITVPSTLYSIAYF